MKYILIDSVNRIIRSFNTYSEADNFRIVEKRPDWLIVRTSTPSTLRQIAAVHFCESILNIQFTGDINNKVQCSNFLSIYLADAKQLYVELSCEYETDRGY